MQQEARGVLSFFQRKTVVDERAPTSGKRKAEVDDEEYMKQNPELYGLRRSVRTHYSWL